MSLLDVEVREIEHRLLAAEQEIRALRITLQLATACICPVGFGSRPDPRCPKPGHGRGAAATDQPETAITTNRRDAMDRASITKAVRRQLRVREPLAARELASRAGLSTKQIASTIAELVRLGEAVKQPGSGSGDRAPRYTAASKAKG